MSKASKKTRAAVSPATRRQRARRARLRSDAARFITIPLSSEAGAALDALQRIHGTVQDAIERALIDAAGQLPSRST